MHCLNCCLFTLLLIAAITGPCVYISTMSAIDLIKVNRNPCFDCNDHAVVEAFSQQCCQSPEKSCVPYQFCADLRVV